MTYRRLSLSVLGLAFLSGQAMATAPAPEKTAPSASVFTPEQEARIGQVAAEYLLA
ncbi:DsbA family protein, partial [Salmonella enterica subsp. diarizonae]|nr:DsbA family protein [Salmonella enterica subsp. diarizonae]